MTPRLRPTRTSILLQLSALGLAVASGAACSPQGAGAMASGGAVDASPAGGQHSGSGAGFGASGGALSQGSGGGRAAGGGQAGGGGQGAGGGLAASGGRTYPDVEFTYDPSKDDSPETCAGKTISAEKLPLDMYVVLDRTASMGEDCALNLNGPPSVASKWCHAANALAQYFSSSAAQGHRAALQFMIPAATTSTECSTAPSNLHTEAEVPFTTLPVLPGSPLLSALDAQIPDSPSTAIESALNGITVYTLAQRTVGREMIGILITDGDPTFCSESTGTLAGIATRHYEETGIRTFIIGMTGATASTLEEIAARAGGPEHVDYCDPADPRPTCHYWSVGEGDAGAFVAALNAIQESAVGCEFALPSTDQGLVKLDTVRVEMSGTPGSDAIVLSQAPDAASCQDGQFYSDSRASTPSLKLCPTTCDLVTEGTRIDITLECYGN